MAENLFCKTHKGSTPAFREGWDRTFCNWLTEDEIDKELQKAKDKMIFTGKETIKSFKIEKVMRFYGKCVKENYDKPSNFPSQEAINDSMDKHEKEMQKDLERKIWRGK